MHLHLWKSQNHQRGHGTYFISQSISKYFEIFHLKYLFCEPHSLNSAPKKTLAKIGFDFDKVYEITSGWINFQQTVNRWVLTKEKWRQSQTT